MFNTESHTKPSFATVAEWRVESMYNIRIVREETVEFFQQTWKQIDTMDMRTTLYYILYIKRTWTEEKQYYI